jgi:hypothetical protein
LIRLVTRSSFALALVVALSVPAGALTLTVDPAQSSIVPQVGPAASLAGTLDVAFGALPVVATTTFDVVAVAVTTSAGDAFALDPASPSPGLGVVNPAGAFLIPTLFLEITSGATSFALAIPNVTGSLVFGPGGASVARLETTFSIDSGTPAGVLSVTLVAIPEPATAALAGAGLLALALRARSACRAENAR